MITISNYIYDFSEGISVTLLESIFLGFIQGITEFFPTSSSGHLSIFQRILNLGYDSSEHLLFDVLLHLATLVSVCLVYRRELGAVIGDTFELLSGRAGSDETEGRMKPGARLALLIVAATLPLFVIVPFHSQIERLYTNIGFIAFALIMTGVLLYISAFFDDGRKTEKTATVVDALIVGAAQAVATIPGVSRSGATITVGLSRGFRRSFAVRFSFLMSIPAVLGSVVVTLISAFRTGIDWSLMPVYLVGMLVAGVVGYFALSIMRRFITQRPLTYFAYYCFGVGVIAIVLAFIT